MNTVLSWGSISPAPNVSVGRLDMLRGHLVLHLCLASSTNYIQLAVYLHTSDMLD